MAAFSVERLRREFDGSFALPLRETATDVVALLAIRVGDKPYALAVAELGGIAVDRLVTPVPSKAKALSGLVGLRGNLVAVFDLATLLGEAPGAETPRWLARCGSAAVAVAFHTLEGHLHVPREALRATPEMQQGLVELVLEDGGELRPIASISRVVQAVSERAGQGRPGKGM